MIDFRAPDGSRPEFMFTTTAYSFTLPAGHSVSIAAVPNGAWEQCALIYMGDQQLNVQLGSDERPWTHVIDPQPYPVQIIVTGWHKEGGPDPDLPWLASQGSHSPGFPRWRDNPSGPFDDLEGRIDMQLGPWYRWSDSISTSPHTYQVSTPLRALQIANWILYYSTLAEAGRSSIAAKAIDEMIDAYLAEGDAREPGRDGAVDVLTFELLRHGHMLQAGSLRDRLLDAARDVIRRADSKAR